MKKLLFLLSISLPLYPMSWLCGCRKKKEAGNGVVKTKYVEPIQRTRVARIQDQLGIELSVQEYEDSLNKDQRMYVDLFCFDLDCAQQIQQRQIKSDGSAIAALSSTLYYAQIRLPKLIDTFDNDIQRLNIPDPFKAALQDAKKRYKEQFEESDKKS